MTNNKSPNKLTLSFTLAATLSLIACASTPDVPNHVTPPIPEIPAPETPKPVRTDTVTIDNGKIRLKQDLTRGGSICYMSASGDNKNVVNIYDEGRYIQQSYYAGRRLNRQSEGQSPQWSPWEWNPIQAGNYAGKRAPILECYATDTTIYVKCIPMLWDMNDHLAAAVMEQWTELKGNVAHVKCKITCNRGDDVYGSQGVPHDQEIPAVYPISEFNHLYAYMGDKPFTNDEIKEMPIVQLESGFWGVYDGTKNPNPSEKWMAFVGNDGWGLGVYSPRATRFLAGRYGKAGGGALSSSTGYISPLRREALLPNSVMEYDYYLILDTLPEIRKAVYQLKQ